MAKRSPERNIDWVSLINVSEIEPDTLPKPYDYYAELLGGVQNLVNLLKHLGGSRVYFHKLESVFSKYRNRQIIMDYKKGQRIEELSRKYNLSDVTVRMIVGNRKSNK
jgi:hypothetical protein